MTYIIASEYSVGCVEIYADVATKRSSVCLPSSSKPAKDTYAMTVSVFDWRNHLRYFIKTSSTEPPAPKGLRRR